jgi:hypothetical protein
MKFRLSREFLLPRGDKSDKGEVARTRKRG